MTTKKRSVYSLPNNPVWIKLRDFEDLCFNFARKSMASKEPIPDFSTSRPGSIESSLKTPWVGFGGKDLYPRFLDKISILFYLMIKNHPFENGNKRIAIATILTILFINEKWISATPTGFYMLAKNVARSKGSNKDMTLKNIKSFFRKYLIELK